MLALFCCSLFSSFLYLNAERPTSCRDGWIHGGGSCYLIRSMTQQWAGAQSVCDFLGAKLLIIESSTENEFIKNQLSALTINHSGSNDLSAKYWTAGTDFQNPGKWLWGKDHTMGFSNWAGGQPITHHCLALDPQNQYTWVATDCERSNNFICEIQLASGQDSTFG
ncbi:perlucin-like [Saccostrea cucullata]|uniref:perlucin-like n=1 Tax=Saccostrea cuccullata TaxID=36930 RepID=UPI002ED5159D